jgi:hypothetical protein
MTTTTTPAPMLSTADLMATVIYSKATQLGFTVYVNHMQDQPDKAILVRDVKGKLDERSMRGTHSGRDGVEIQVRAYSHAEAGNVLPVLWEDVLKGVNATSVAGKIVQCVTKANTMGCMGQEPQTRRWRFIQSFLVTVI